MSRSRRRTRAASASATERLIRAAAAAAALSGAPSTAWALVTRTDPLAATYAAGRLLAPRATRPATLLAAAALTHAAVSVGWTAVLMGLPRGRGRAVGYGLAIATLDLGLARAVRGPRFTPIAGLALLPQVADHVAFAVVVDAWAEARTDRIINAELLPDATTTRR